MASFAASTSKVLRGIIACSLVTTFFVAGACGSDSESSSGGGKGGSGGKGGRSGAGGKDAGSEVGLSGSSGSSGSGGAGGTMGDASGDGAACLYTGTPIDTSAMPACPAELACPNSRCLANAAVPPETADRLPGCDAANKCVPDKFIQQAGKFIMATCRSLNDAEGRCAPTCLPEIQKQKDQLTKSTCADDELCAPCFHPVTGEDTGACNVSCDTGPKEPKKTFDTCCDGLGVCVTKDLVPDAQESLLDKGNCAGADLLCAPKLLTDATKKPPVCKSLLDAEGRCLPSCLPSIAKQPGLPKDICETGHVCAPCFNPIDGKPTGACGVNGDMPTDPNPKTFTSCCHDLGKCVPTAAAGSQASLLGQDSCTVTGDLCAPTTLAQGAKPPTCRAMNNQFEGRCLPDCLPSIQAQKDKLDRSTCAEFHLCAPCFDPVKPSMSTGACTTNGDQPVDPPAGFQQCCGMTGACVTKNLIPDAQEPLLGKDVCTAADVLCVPSELTNSTFIPPVCKSLGGGEGRCMAKCLPSIAAQGDRLPADVCMNGRVCAPCFDPTNGMDTGACKVNGDTPKQPPYLFPGCCPNDNNVFRSTCVPRTLVPPGSGNPPSTGCPDSSWACVPKEKVANQSFKFPTCVGNVFGLAGACVPDCLVADVGAFLDEGNCPTGQRLKCAPCDLLGTPTGACN